MTRRRRLARRVAAAATLLSIVWLAAPVPPAESAGVESGWWWKGNPGATAPFPAPVPVVNLPAVPPGLPIPPSAAGGLFVAALPDGAFSVAAVRADVDTTSITLSVAENGSVNGSAAHLLACASRSPWTPAEGGRWDDKPTVACDLSNGGASVAGIIAADGLSWTFPVAPLVDGGAIDVVIVPTGDTATPAGLVQPFALTFEKPDMGALVVNTNSPLGESEFGTFDAGGSDDYVASEQDGSLSFVGGLAPGVSPGPIASPALPPAAQSPPIVLSAPAGRRVLADTEPTDRAKALALLVVLAAMALTYAASRQALPPLRGLAGVSAHRPPAEVTTAPVVGGLGRFRRERMGTPPKLS